MISLQTPGEQNAYRFFVFSLAGSLAMLGFRLIERAGAPQMDRNDPFIVMLVFWGVGLWRARRRLG